MAVTSRIFGAHIPEKIKQKLNTRQQLPITSREAMEPLSSDYKQNFDGVGGGVDLSSRTPFARIWTAIEATKKEFVASWTKDRPPFLIEGEVYNPDNKEIRFNHKFESEKIS